MNDDERQRAIHETVIRIDERQEAHCERFEDHVELTDRRFAHINKTVYGTNGSPGPTSQKAIHA